MSEKSQRLADLLAKVPVPAQPLPSGEGRSLLEVAFLCVLGRRLSESAAEKTLAAFAGAYSDWNELRVSQIQEFQHLVQTKSPELAVFVARDTREFLQEIYQKIHGFNLDVLRGDIAEAARFAALSEALPVVLVALAYGWAYLRGVRRLEGTPRAVPHWRRWCSPGSDWWCCSNVCSSR